MKRRLYGNPTDNEQDDEELSLDRIKRNVSLKRSINRRYREFMELHNRLTGGELCEHMKGKRARGTHLFNSLGPKLKGYLKKTLSDS